MRRSFIGVAVAATLVIGFTANAWAASPPKGVFQGIVNGTSHSSPVCGAFHNEGEGYFRVKRNPNGSKRIVPVGNNSNYCGGLSVPKITAPSDTLDNCLSGGASLPVPSIRLSGGRFEFSGNAPIGFRGSTRHVQFKGHWDSARSRFVGFTRITRGSGCDSGKKYWRMKKVAN